MRSTAVLLLFLTGCVSLTPQATKVVVADDDATVEDCEILASIEANPPFIGPNDAEKTLRNKTAAEGGDTLLITDMNIGPAKGQAYDCRAGDEN
jgi:hypothetical protein